MNRCTRTLTFPTLISAPAGHAIASRAGRQALAAWRFAACAAALCLGAALAPSAHAQMQSTPEAMVRQFPANALRGSLQVTQPPQVMLDGKVDRLSPAARINSPQNMMVMSGALVGHTYVVNYTREPGGAIREVWLLTPQEAAVRRAGAGGNDGNFILKALGLAPKPAPRDDGRTPFNQLPVYPRQ